MCLDSDVQVIVDGYLLGFFIISANGDSFVVVRYQFAGFRVPDDHCAGQVVCIEFVTIPILDVGSELCDLSSAQSLSTCDLWILDLAKFDLEND